MLHPLLIFLSESLDCKMCFFYPTVFPLSGLCIQVIYSTLSIRRTNICSDYLLSIVDQLELPVSLKITLKKYIQAAASEL